MLQQESGTVATIEGSLTDRGKGLYKNLCSRMVDRYHDIPIGDKENRILIKEFEVDMRGELITGHAHKFIYGHISRLVAFYGACQFDKLFPGQLSDRK